jgi:hypothetical protein
MSVRCNYSFFCTLFLATPEAIRGLTLRLYPMTGRAERLVLSALMHVQAHTLRRQGFASRVPSSRFVGRELLSRTL